MSSLAFQPIGTCHTLELGQNERIVKRVLCGRRREALNLHPRFHFSFFEKQTHSFFLTFLVVALVLLSMTPNDGSLCFLIVLLMAAKFVHAQESDDDAQLATLTAYDVFL